jgi:MFS family permease
LGRLSRGFRERLHRKVKERRPGATLVQALSVGTGPLRRSRDFRFLWLAALPAGLAMGAISLALFVQAYAVTESPSILGLDGLTQFAALAVGTLGESTIVDQVDRRTRLLLTQAGFGVAVVVLWLASLAGDPPIAASSAPTLWDPASRASTSRPGPR